MLHGKTGSVYKNPVSNQTGAKNRRGGAKTMPVVMKKSKGHVLTGGKNPPRTTGK